MAIYNFILRVQLDHPETDFYDDLHKALEAIGFSQTITSSKTGRKFELPRAEYHIQGDYTRSDVFEAAKDTVESIVGKKYGLLITGRGGISWNKLTVIED